MRFHQRPIYEVVDQIVFTEDVFFPTTPVEFFRLCLWETQCFPPLHSYFAYIDQSIGWSSFLNLHWSTENLHWVLSSLTSLSRRSLPSIHLHYADTPTSRTSINPLVVIVFESPLVDGESPLVLAVIVFQQHWFLAAIGLNEELLRENKRMIDRSIREIERERQGLQTQEKKVIARDKEECQTRTRWNGAVLVAPMCKTNEKIVPIELCEIVGRSFTFKLKLTNYNLASGNENFTVSSICHEEYGDNFRHDELMSSVLVFNQTGPTLSNVSDCSDLLMLNYRFSESKPA
ncbi:hypothetical protein Syun_022160 [Stephania yunnanensis]|uniref:Uncharacterized protein n=1 Tax=Stephania yunnanensis TaxID=152371 RepID=A0AAP0IH42_9MAGN